MIQAPGSNGTVLEEVEVSAAMADGKGNLAPGRVRLPAGTLIHVPADKAEIRKILRLQAEPNQ